MTAIAISLFDISTLDIDNFEHDILSAMLDEKLDTYTDIANHLGETAEDVLTALTVLNKRNIVNAVEGKPKRYYINDGSSIKQPKLDQQPTTRPPTPEEKLDYPKITELAGDGVSRANIAKALDILPSQFKILASHNGPIGILIRKALLDGEAIRRERKAAAQVTEPKFHGCCISAPHAGACSVGPEPEIDEPEAAASPTSEDLPEEAAIDAIPELPSPEPHPDHFGNKVSEAEEPHELIFEPGHEDRLPLQIKTQCTRTVINLENGGTVTIELAYDAFKASELDRSLVEAIVETVQVYEQKRA